MPRTTMLPEADTPDEELDDWLGTDVPDMPPEPPVRPVTAVSGEPEGDYGPDPEPAHLSPPRRGRGQRDTGTARKPVRVTAAVKADVTAKVRIVTKSSAEIWAMRDPFCGPVAIGQEPAIADALVDLICDSPDLLAFFAGAGGAYMRYFKLFMACLPVIQVAWVHHIAHQPGQPDGQAPVQQPVYANFAA